LLFATRQGNKRGRGTLPHRFAEKKPTTTGKEMAALDLATIPSSINTYERLAVWALQSLQSISNGGQVNVVTGTASTPIAQVQVAVTADNVDRFILSAYIPLDLNALNSATQKTWMSAKDIATAAPHANLLAN